MLTSDKHTNSEVKSRAVGENAGGNFILYPQGPRLLPVTLLLGAGGATLDTIGKKHIEIYVNSYVPMTLCGSKFKLTHYQ